MPPRYNYSGTRGAGAVYRLVTVVSVGPFSGYGRAERGRKAVTIAQNGDGLGNAAGGVRVRYRYGERD